MVLRRPYSFLIKYFKIIHLIITALLGYLVFLNMEVYKYLKTVISDTNLRYNALSYINKGIYVLIVIAVLLCFAIYWLLKYKDKPRKIYVFTIVGYLIIAMFMLTLYGYMSGFSNSVPDQKTIRLYRDILMITLGFQYYVILFMLIRGLGFDIKKFNFGKDVQELNLNASDSAEVEINTSIDTTRVKRTIHRQGREWGYFYQEYKKYIIGIVVIIIGILGFSGYKLFVKKFKVYKEQTWVGNVTAIAVKDSYFGATEDGSYVILDVAFNKTGTKEKLNMGNLILVMGGKRYTADKKVCSKFNYLGTCYKQQYLSDTTANYLVAYNVENINTSNVYLIYSETYDNSYKIKLSLKSASN